MTPLCTESVETSNVVGLDGETSYDMDRPVYENTVFAVKDCESPTESGSYWYSCSRCGAGAWSGL